MHWEVDDLDQGAQSFWISVSQSQDLGKLWKEVKGRVLCCILVVTN